MDILHLVKNVYIDFNKPIDFWINAIQECLTQYQRELEIDKLL